MKVSTVVRAKFSTTLLHQ